MPIANDVIKDFMTSFIERYSCEGHVGFVRYYVEEHDEEVFGHKEVTEELYYINYNYTFKLFYLKFFS